MLTKSYTYDCLGNCSRVTDALENTASATYDSMGNVETLTNPNGGVTSYRYDLNNNLTDEIIGEDYHVRYTYNAQDLASARTNSRNQKTIYEYDALGRITKQTDEAGVIEYTYDANDNVLKVQETIGGRTGTITRTYDGLNRVTSYEDAGGNKIGYQYDKLGNLVKLTYSNGEDVTYTYDKNGSIKTVTDWTGRTTAYGYDESGRLIETKRANGTIETRSYDKAGNLTRILDKNGDTVINQQDYRYDAEGNIAEVKQLYSGKLDFTGVTTAQMTYDNNNRLLTYNGEKIKYDKDGNMTYGPLQGRMTEFAFDCRNRLIKAGDTSYEYDAENNRIAVTTGTKRTEYVVNSQPELSQVLQSTVTDTANKAAQPETTYYFYGKGLISQENKAGGYLTYHFNNVGSTMAVTNQKGKVIKEYAYSPYGELLLGESDGSIQFLYNGQFGVTTDANGLYYMRARYYNVDIKRFINQDVLTGTLERISSLNRYAYVEGNPVSFLDPFGLEKDLIDALHEGIANAQSIILLVQIALTAVSVIAGAAGNLALTAYSSYYFVILYKFSNILTAVDALLYTYDVLNPNNKGDKFNDLTSAVLSIIGLFNPLKEICSGGNQGFTDWEKLGQIIKSFGDWLKGETANNLLEWSKLEVE